MKNHKWDFLAASFALLLTAGYFWYSGEWNWWRKSEPHAITQSLYLGSPTTSALAASTATGELGAVSQVFVLVHDGDTPIDTPDWGALATCGKPVILAFRYPPALAGDIEARLPAVAWKMGLTMMGTCALAEQHGVDVRGIHIDYDAPFNTLGEYESFLQRMLWRIPPRFSVSISVAPEWIESDHFGNLTRGVRSYVIVVKEDAIPLKATDGEGSPGRILDWIARADLKERPFAIEFRVPTEGATGSADIAEAPAPSATSGSPALSTDPRPESMALLVRDLLEAHAENLRGFIWNPMPAAPPLKPWPSRAFSSLVSGRIPLDAVAPKSTQLPR